MSDLTLPGDIPGLLRRGSPVIYRRRQDVVCDDPGDAVYIGSVDFRVALDMLALDLTDPTGRAHAAWWLASDVSARWSPCAFVASAGPSWMVTALKGGHSVTTYGARSGWRAVPGLAGLNPNDPRTLPDGSRWADIEALRMVCLHVAGRTS